MSSSKSHSPVTSPAKNTSANYESAAREIEQEKQMVAALKRLSIGQLMNTDPDMPASDASFSFLVDRELQPEPVPYPDSPSSAKTSSSSSSDSVSGSTAHSQPAPQTQPATQTQSEHEDSGHLRVSSKPSSKPTSRRSSTQGSVESSHQVSPEYTRPSSLGEDPRPEETLWVPANVHPEVNPQQYKNHVRTTFDEMLERKLSRSKSASRSKRSSLSLSTTDELSFGPEKAAKEARVSPENDKSPQAHDSLEPGEIHVRNRLSNPSLRKLTSELQTMSRLAGMDSNDAVTLARSLSTSSLGYSDVERTAIGEIEHANNFPTNVSHAEFVDASDENLAPMDLPGSYNRNPHGSAPYQGHPAADPRSRGPIRSEPPYRYANGDPGQFGSNPNYQNRSQEDFSLRRSRRVDYRKSPTTLSSGSQLQSNKAGKLAQLRHNLSSTNLHSSTHDIGRERLTVKQPTSRPSIQSINPRSSQVLFNYKDPSHHPSSGRAKSLTKTHSSSNIASKNPQASSAGVPLAGLSAKDSPYSTAMASDALGRNLHPTKYSQHNITAKSLGSPNGSPAPSPAPSPSPSHKKYDPSASPRSGHRSTSREHDIQPNQLPYSAYKSKSNQDLRDSNSWKAHSSHSGHRKISPTSPQAQSSPMRVPSRESPVLNQGQWSEHQSGKRQAPTRNVSAGSSSHIAVVSPSQQQSPRASVGHPGELTKVRSYSKREKTRELNQNLDLLRNEINEFKESLAKVDPNEQKPQVSKQKEPKVQEEPTDFSFDLTNQDVSYEGTLGIEGDVLTELTSENSPSFAQSSPETKKNSISLGESKKDVFVPVLESSNIDVKDSSSKEPVIVQPKSVDNFKERISPKETPRQEHITPTGDSREENLALNSKLDSSKPFKELKILAESAAQTKLTEPGEEFVHGVGGNEAENSKNQPHHIFTMSTQEDPSQTNEITRHSTTESVESPDKHNSNVSLDLSSGRATGTEKKRGKKNWPWSKGKSTNSTPADENTTPKEARSPVRSVSSPEMMGSKRDAPTAQEASGKENAISKFFKKRRSSSVSHEKSNSDQFQTKKSMDSSDSDFDQHSQGKSRGKRNSRSSERSFSDETSSHDSNKDHKRDKVSEDAKSSDDQKVSSRIKNRIKNMTKIHEEKEEKPESQVVVAEVQEETAIEEDNSKPKSTIEVQEKLKKSIKRYSRPNQPIEFTDSAFGFPLPPPSSSTLVMIDYRFPVHVERAIYRLSHLKLANPKRSLREQVILSNFMYAYLNLVDHTLHLEQQMTSDDFEAEQPDGDLDFLGEQDIDTEFEADDGFEESDFESIKIDLDVKDNQISV